MLEVLHRDGRGRVLHWEPAGPAVTTPALVVPDTSLLPVPDAADVVVCPPHRAAALAREGRVVLASGGTWFHPEPDAAMEAAVAAGAVAVPPMAPSPTDQVQVEDLPYADLAVFHDAGGWASDPSRLVPAWIDAVAQAGAGRALWAPHLGRPDDAALWAYLGADLFDASPLLLAAVRGEVLTTDGALTLEEAAEVLGDGTPWTVEDAARHNIEAMQRELRLVRHHVRQGTLRSLVERRVASRPASVEVLRRMDAEHAFLEAATPVQRPGPLACMTSDSLWMPEVEHYRRRMREAYRPPQGADVLVLLPCSAKKPYRMSKSHRFFHRALDDSGLRHRVHEAMVTSPLGIVPRELEESYPARAYDVPVTGRWTGDEEAVIRTQLAALLATGGHRHVVVHTDEKTWGAMAPVLEDHAARTGITVTRTATGRPTSIEDCGRLRDHLRQIRDAERTPARPEDWRARKLADVAAVASYQFGPEAAAALTTGAIAHGRWPYVKLTAAGRGNTQYGMTTPDRGLLSLTPEGAERVAPWAPKMYLQDFPLKKTKSVFAVGVIGATPDVRPGDEVLAVHRRDDGSTELRGVGVAQMAAHEMGALKRGVAATLRHTVKEPLVVPDRPVAGADAADDAAKRLVTAGGA